MPALAIRPLTPERWPDLEAVFMARGCSVARGCWCMFYRETGSFILPGGKQPQARSRFATRDATGVIATSERARRLVTLAVNEFRRLQDRAP
jgi:hypothetical protein